MDSGSENDSAGDGRSADERRDRKNLRQIAKRRRAEKELRKREKALGGKREPRRLRRGRKKVAALTAPEEAQKTDKPRMRKLRFAFVILGLGLLAFVSWIFGIMMAVAQDLPSLENRQQYLEAENSVVYDAYNNKLTTLTNNQGRILLDSAEIAPVMKEAVVAIEDRRFYEHNGVDYQGIARAVWQDVVTRSAQQGASTITQQFVKNALAAQDSRTVFQKLREAALAYHLERNWTKDKILTEYLNEIYFGEGATGIEAAAKTYFSYNHPGCGETEDAEPCASELLPWEAALLAGIISSPSAYSPRAFPENAKIRRDQVLANMRDEGYITPEEYAEYAEIPIPDDKDLTPPAENSAAPYFTSWLRQQLVDRYGAGEAFGGGLQIRSTLDLELQNRVQAITQSTLAGIQPTASAVVLDNETGGVLAMVGGSDFEASPFNLATNGHRQPGSAFKPFTLVTALQQGRSTSEVFTSAPQEIPFQVKVPRKNGNGDKVLNDTFNVSNYNDSYLGSASIASGTTYSDNSVYSQLGTQVGVENVAATANAMGIETDLASSFDYSINDGPWHPYNPALILGGLETGVTPLEMTHAYNTLAADGRRLSGTMAASSGGPVAILKVTDGDDPTDGDLVPDQTGADGENELVDRQVIDPTVAQTAKDVLSTVVTSGTGRARSEQRHDLGQDRDHRRQRRRLVLRRDDEVHRLHLGRLPRHRHPDGDRVRRGTGRRRDLPGADLRPDRRRLRRGRGAAQGRRGRGRDVVGGHRRGRRRDRHPDDGVDRVGRAAGDRGGARPRRAAGGGGRAGARDRGPGGAARRRRRCRRRARPPDLWRRRQPGLGRSPEGRQRPRQVGAPGSAEPPRELGRLGDPDPGPGGHLDPAPRALGRAELERLAIETGSVELEADAECLGQLAGARAQLAQLGPPAPGPHLLDPGDRFERPDQDRSSGPVGLADGIEEAVDPVGEVDVGASRRAEDGRRPLGQPDVGVAGRVVALVALGLDDHPAGGADAKLATDQIPGDPVHRAVEEPRSERAQAGSGRVVVRVARAASSCSARRAAEVPPADSLLSSHEPSRRTS